MSCMVFMFISISQFAGSGEGFDIFHFIFFITMHSSMMNILLNDTLKVVHTVGVGGMGESVNTIYTYLHVLVSCY